MSIESYRDLIVWQKAMELVTVVYGVTEKFPKAEVYGLTSQIRRSVVSIPSNIAEGRRRGSRKDFRNFLLHAYGSGAELETQIEIAKQLNVNQSSITKSINGNCDYRSGKRVYGGAKKKLRRLADEDLEVQEILANIAALQDSY